MEKITKNVVFKPNNKKQVQFIDTVMKAEHTVFLFGGAIRGGKTFVVLCITILLCKIFPGSRWVIVRKDLKRLRENTRPSLNKFITGVDVKINEQHQTFMFPNGSMIMFKGENYDRDKTLESFKGLETNGFILEEVSEIREVTYYKCIERAGSYIIPNVPLDKQPPPLVLMTCNPTQTWVKQLIYDPWKLDQELIQKNAKPKHLPKHVYYLPSYVTDNEANLTKSYLENIKNMPLYEYEVFVLGNWDVVLKTSNAFWHQFTMDQVKGVFYDPETTVHVSIDANSLPYCSASFWQVYPKQKKLVQFHEIAASDPNNHASGLGRLVAEYLNEVEYADVLYIYGDASTKNQNTIDPDKKSFFDLFLEQLASEFKTIDEIAQSNPRIAKTGEFVNALHAGYDGWKLIIGETCKYSISDYMSVKKAMDGTMEKKRETDDEGSSYEKHGHFSDCKRYLCHRLINDVFHKWDGRFSEPSEPLSVDPFEDYEESY